MSNPRISLARLRFNQRRESRATKFAERVVLPIVVAFGLGVLVTLSVVEGREQPVNLVCDEVQPHISAHKVVVAGVR